MTVVALLAGSMGDIARLVQVALPVTATPKKRKAPPKASRYIQLPHSLKLPDLRSRCRDFNLDSTGNKPVLVERILEFSEKGHEHWLNAILPGALRNHKGSRDWIINTAVSRPTTSIPLDSTISTAPKKKRKLNVHQTRIAAAAENTRAQQNFPVERSRDTRTEEEKQNVIPWAKHVMDMALQSTEELINSISGAVVSNLRREGLLVLSSSTTFIQPSPSHPLPLPSANHVPPSSECSLSGPASSPNASTSTASTVSTTEGPAAASVSRAATIDAIPDISASSPRPALTRSITFVNGESFSFADSEIPATVPSRPIPLRYWKQLYVYNKEHGQEWKRLKNMWLNWHYFMKAYNDLGADQFWTRFILDTGRRMSFTKICAELLSERKTRDAQRAEEIRIEYGSEGFAKEFEYWNSKKQCRVVMSEPAKIVSAYCKKRGLQNNDEEDDD
ncbi:hypothetical protein BDZ89DRAFT_1043580 [Hymenopellis radicata]|nr:hypothetical protein BDZ89DRAFT_1043580 [Hymenopellis radicata]